MGSLKFGSFPRSGNHFFLYLTDCEWLDHRIEPLGTEENVVVSIRNPLECVPSWITFIGDKRKTRAEKVLEWYCAYYSKCVVSKVVIIPFEQLISKPLYCIEYVANHYGLDIKVKEFDSLDDICSPSKDKSGFVDIVEEMKVAPSFEPAMKLFESLCKPI